MPEIKLMKNFNYQINGFSAFSFPFMGIGNASVALTLQM